MIIGRNPVLHWEEIVSINFQKTIPAKIVHKFATAVGSRLWIFVNKLSINRCQNWPIEYHTCGISQHKLFWLSQYSFWFILNLQISYQSEYPKHNIARLTSEIETAARILVLKLSLQNVDETTRSLHTYIAENTDDMRQQFSIYYSLTWKDTQIESLTLKMPG